METLNDKLRTIPLKVVEIKPGVSFEANGKKYTPSETFTIGRFEKVEELEEELLMFSDKQTCHQVMLAAMSRINEFNPGEAYTLLYNKIESDQRNVKLAHYTLRLLAAYINYEGEDLRYLTEDMITTKINDWSEEGFDIRPFLAFAVSVYGELLQRYKQPIQNILKEAKSIKESIDEVLDIRNLTQASASGPVR